MLCDYRPISNYVSSPYYFAVTFLQIHLFDLFLRIVNCRRLFDKISTSSSSYFFLLSTRWFGFDPVRGGGTLLDSRFYPRYVLAKPRDVKMSGYLSRWVASISQARPLSLPLQSTDLEGFKQVKSVSRATIWTQNDQLLNITFARVTPFVIYEHLYYFHLNTMLLFIGKGHLVLTRYFSNRRAAN